MTESDAAHINLRLDNLVEALQRIEALIKQEVSDLKTEQIAHVEKTTDRLADDQRRLWEAVRALESRADRAHGGGTVIQWMITGVVALFTSGVAAVFIEKFLK